MARQYYYLVAGLPDLYLEVGAVRMPNHGQFKADIAASLHPADVAHWQAMYSIYDNKNLLAYLANDKAEFDPLGNFTQAEFEEALTNSTDVLPRHIALFMADHCTQTAQRLECAIPPQEREEVLLTYFYQQTDRSANKFVRAWFEFDRQWRNVQAALLCRHYGRDIADNIIGTDDVTHALRHSQAADFGLKGETTWIDTLLHILDGSNMVEQEWNLDNMRVDVAQSLNTFEYFSLDKILELAVLMQIADRWQGFSDEVGAARLKGLIEQIHESFQTENVFG